MAFFTDNFLNNRRTELLRAVTRFQYQLNKSTWVDGEINSKEIAGTAVVVHVNAPSSDAKDTITGVRVYDNNGVLAGSQSVSLSRDSINARSAAVYVPADRGRTRSAAAGGSKRRTGKDFLSKEG